MRAGAGLTARVEYRPSQIQTLGRGRFQDNQDQITAAGSSKIGIAGRRRGRPRQQAIAFSQYVKTRHRRFGRRGHGGSDPD